MFVSYRDNPEIIIINKIGINCQKNIFRLNFNLL